MDKKIQEKKYFLDAADKIVIKLSQETFPEKQIVPFLKQIEPYHYEEIVEERFVSKLCGYLCCPHELINIPTKKYQISTKLNKVYDLTDRKRYCSKECYKSSKYLEAQISNVPVWLRQTAEFLKGDGANEIKFWPSIKVPKAKKLEPEPLQKTVNQLASEQIDKNLAVEIESELKQMEKDWTEKFKIQEPSTESQYESKTLEAEKCNVLNEAQIDSDLKERSEQLKKKFIESIDIHKKPTDFNNLKKIFLFKIKKDDECLELGEGAQVFQISEKNLTQLYFIEFIIQRIKELITNRTKSYLQQTEPIDRPSVNQEREREEHLEACDKLVATKTALYSDIDYTSQASGFSKTNFDQNDNGEEEMLEKLRGFEEIIKDNSKDAENTKEILKQEEPVHDELGSEAKKPLPDYAKLKEEAVRQQLRIREFFGDKSTAKKLEKVTVVDENDTNSEYSQNLIFKIKETDEEIVRVLPTVDSKSQTQIRRKIFYDKLVKYLEQILKFSEFNYTVISNSLKNHVKNFVYSLKLTSENIIFSTSEWPIVCLFILKLLSVKRNLVNNLFEQLVKEDRLIETILSSFSLDQIKLDLICDFLILN